MATNLSHSRPKPFLARPAEVVTPELIGCLLVKRHEGGSLDINRE